LVLAEVWWAIGGFKANLVRVAKGGTALSISTAATSGTQFECRRILIHQQHF
jgi:hypothetical protein